MSLLTRVPEVLNRGSLVKICGLREPEHALVAADGGADFLGLVFARSKRQVTVDQAQAVVQAVRQQLGESSPLFAGIFIDDSPHVINAVASSVGLDLVQLHGAGDPARFQEISYPIVRALGPPPDSTVEDVIREIENQRIDSDIPALFLLDAYDPVNHGGSGRLADWVLSADVARRISVVLAGGLTPDNVATAITTVRPIGVDVSSGVERDGVKDPQRIRDFIANARRSFIEIETMSLNSANKIDYPKLLTKVQRSW